MKIIREAQQVDFFDFMYSFDDKDRKEIGKLSNEISRCGKNFYDEKNGMSSAVLYFNVQHLIDVALNKVAAEYEIGNKNFSEPIDDFIDQLTETLKITSDATKILISNLGGLNKALKKLPSKEDNVN